MIVNFNIKLTLYINTMAIFACNGNPRKPPTQQKSGKRDCKN